MRDPRLIDYYDRRAPEYERIYQRPERRGDLQALAGLLGELVADRDVLEVACGTGYWTTLLAPRTRSWLATDAAPAVLEIARGKTYPPGRVAFELADAWALAELAGRFDAAVAGFFWSHVPRERLPRFLAGLGSRLEAGARVILFDNLFVPGSSTPISRRDAAGNTWQRRRLDDGSEREVLKNFPGAGELLAAAAAAGGVAPSLVELRHFWCLTYLVPAPGRRLPEETEATAARPAAPQTR